LSGVCFANEGPCRQIKEACEKAGFVKGGAKNGNGLWKNCIHPIMSGAAATNAAHQPPQVSPSLINQCKEKHPHFGMKEK
jgi:hypothetical protein